MFDPLSAFVGMVIAFAVSFGADRVWLWYGASPRERSERRIAKWQAKAAKRRL